MSKFACIYFIQDNIIVSKDRSFIKKHPKITIESVWYKDIESYKVNIYSTFQTFTSKDWQYLENQLILKDVEYVYMPGKGKTGQLFEEILIVDGREILPLTSYYILEYINRYKLIFKDRLSAKIGVIAGEVEETIDLIKSIMDDVTDLTLFVGNPLVYKDIVIALRAKKQLKIRAVKPNEPLLREMDIVFDLKTSGIHAGWCDPKAIYIDYRNKTLRHMKQLEGPLPSIWYGFDIIWEGRSIEIPILQMLLGIQGLTGSILRREFKHLNLSIAGVHARRIS
nr:hypothetical protein [uncultured Niameybacter sp.]